MKVYNTQSNENMNDGLISILENIRFNKNFVAKEYIEKKSNLLNQYMNKYNLKSCVVAVSGGIDSAIVLGIIKHASLQDNSPIQKIIPLLLPLFDSTGVTNQNEATDRGKELCEKLNVNPYVIDLSNINHQIRTDLESVIGITGKDWAIGQLGPYSRTPVIYYTTSLLCQEGYNAIVCGTTNRDEGAYLGYVGKASDGLVDVQLISDIHKSEVYQVAKELGIPSSIIDVTPSGDMYDNRTDETVFGAPYDFVELYLNYLNMESEVQNKILSDLNQDAKDQFSLYSNNLENLHRYNLHKYMAKSPSIHLDLWDSSVKGGWDNYYEISHKLLSE